jgi:hypothetical protein
LEFVLDLGFVFWCFSTPRLMLFPRKKSFTALGAGRTTAPGRDMLAEH